VIEFRRTMMVYKRDAEQVQDLFPVSDAEWSRIEKMSRGGASI